MFLSWLFQSPSRVPQFLAFSFVLFCALSLLFWLFIFFLAIGIPQGSNLEPIFYQHSHPWWVSPVSALTNVHSEVLWIYSPLTVLESQHLWPAWHFQRVSNRHLQPNYPKLSSLPSCIIPEMMPSCPSNQGGQGPGGHIVFLLSHFPCISNSSLLVLSSRYIQI